MPVMTRSPIDARLRAAVRLVWASMPGDGAIAMPGAREHVLPTGALHIALRISGPPLRLFDGAHDVLGRTVAHALVGGARSRFHVRDIAEPVASVGALLQPGAARALLGASEGDLAGRHTPLDAFWGCEADYALAQLQEARTPAARLDAFEGWLLRRLGRQSTVLAPGIAKALAALRAHPLPIGELAQACGYSHRHFIALFRESTGLAPKAYARVQRLDRLLGLASDPAQRWAELALRAGFGDQAHLAHEFKAMTGMSPQAWRGAQPASPRHVPVPAVGIQ